MSAPAPPLDCRHHRGDRPCAPAKARGVSCADCGEFAPRGPRAVVLKFGSLGDVLRTTFLAGAIRRALPGATVDWITHAAHLPLFEGNDEVREAIPFDAGALARLQVERWDLLVNLELSREACAAATLARAGRKAGFLLSGSGDFLAADPAAVPFLAMCRDDAAKRANIKSYQRLALEIAGLAAEPSPPVYAVTPAERTRAAAHIAAAGRPPAPARPLVGLHAGSGRRWLSKRWPFERFRELAALIAARGGSALLLAGPDEPELADAARAAGLAALGPDLPLRDFAAAVSLLDALVCGDTFPLHLALALRVPTVALFGPTSSAEVDLFGRGVKLEPDTPCRCYYRAGCSEPEPCMATIPAARVADSLASLGLFR